MERGRGGKGRLGMGKEREEMRKRGGRQPGCGPPPSFSSQISQWYSPADDGV